jgi:hypothetical protein
MERQIKTIAAIYTPHLTKAVAALAVVIALSLFLYGFFLLEAVAHTASRTHAQREIANLTSTLGSLEQEYLSKTRTITLEHARALGFVAPVDVSVVYAGGPAHALSARVQY